MMHHPTHCIRLAPLAPHHAKNAFAQFRPGDPGGYRFENWAVWRLFVLAVLFPLSLACAVIAIAGHVVTVIAIYAVGLPIGALCLAAPA